MSPESLKVFEEHGPGRVYHLDRCEVLLLLSGFGLLRLRLSIVIVDLVSWEREFPKIVASNKVAVPEKNECSPAKWQHGAGQASFSEVTVPMTSRSSDRNSMDRCIVLRRRQSAPWRNSIQFWLDKQPITTSDIFPVSLQSSDTKIHTEVEKRLGPSCHDFVPIDPGTLRTAKKIKAFHSPSLEILNLRGVCQTTFQLMLS